MAAIACQMSVDTVIGEARAQTIQPAEVRPRARDIGVAPGVQRPGALNAITDVEGVLSDTSRSSSLHRTMAKVCKSDGEGTLADRAATARLRRKGPVP